MQYSMFKSDNLYKIEWHTFKNECTQANVSQTMAGTEIYFLKWTEYGLLRSKSSLAYYDTNWPAKVTCTSFVFVI